LKEISYIVPTITDYNNMEKMNTQEIKDLVFQYVKKEYMEDEDVELTYETPLISSGYVDSFSMVSLLIFIEISLKLRFPPAKRPQKHSTV
jgi:acyl carrier protein